MGDFRSMKARDLQRILQKVGYTVVRQKGSHRILEADDRPRLIFAFHDRQTLPPGLVKKILLNDAALSEAEARKLL